MMDCRVVRCYAAFDTVKQTTAECDRFSYCGRSRNDRSSLHLVLLGRNTCSKSLKESRTLIDFNISSISQHKLCSCHISVIHISAIYISTCLGLWLHSDWR